MVLIVFNYFNYNPHCRNVCFKGENEKKNQRRIKEEEKPTWERKTKQGDEGEDGGTTEEASEGG